MASSARPSLRPRQPPLYEVLHQDDGGDDDQLNIIIGGDRNVGLPIKKKTPKAVHQAAYTEQSESQMMDVEQHQDRTPQSGESRGLKLNKFSNKNIHGSKKKVETI